jgi:bifunctional NMN adenylyltransferase/nudix hydrolase
MPEYPATFQEDIIVYIGRFQVWHKMHFENLELALAKGRDVLIMLGSANMAPSPDNPFSAEEREIMIRASIIENGLRGELSRVHFFHVNDNVYNNDYFIDQVRENVRYFKETCCYDSTDVAILAPKKDEKTAEYLEWFKDWKQIEIAVPEDCISASDIRAEYFELDEGCMPCGFPANIDPAVRKFMFEFSGTAEYKRLRKEYNYINGYLPHRKGTAAYDINDCAGDAVVKTASGHLLLVQRGGEIGYGQWALPGGHLNIDETFKQCAIRELEEETSIDCPTKVLIGNIKDSDIFDYPTRSPQTRMISRAFYIEIPDTTPPKITAGDDAMDVGWFTLTEVKRMKLFQDHMAIIQHFTKI